MTGLFNLSSNLASRMLVRVYVHVGHPGSDRSNKLSQFRGRDTLSRRAADIVGLELSYEPARSRCAVRCSGTTAEEDRNPTVYADLSKMDVSGGCSGTLKILIRQVVLDLSAILVYL